MKNLTLLFILIAHSVWAQTSAQENLYSFNDFMLIEKVVDQEKKYNEILKGLSKDKNTPSVTNDFRGELAYRWLAEGNVKRYNYYKATNPEFSARQFLYITSALEKLYDEKKEYGVVKDLSNVLLDDIKNGKLIDVVSRTPVLMELNAASNAKLGNIDIAQKLIAESSKHEGSSAREIKYFKDMKSNYYNRYAVVMAAAGKHQVAFDTLVKAFKIAETNPYTVSTFKDVYKYVKGSTKGFDRYLETLQKEAYQKYYKEVEKTYISTPQKTIEGFIPNPSGGDEMITLFHADKPRSEIEIHNLDGNIVKLGDYSGKILAIDFWTTLCTPCVAAFSGFEGVVSDYKKDEFQMFVINIFETEPSVKSYVSQKGITLDVLRDEPNTAYNIQGTPTKIIYDSMGNIRFYAVGYAGATDREYFKLKAMVEIVKTNESK